MSLRARSHGTASCSGRGRTHGVRVLAVLAPPPPSPAPSGAAAVSEHSGLKHLPEPARNKALDKVSAVFVIMPL
jgi:hypothetical protein